MDNITHSLIGVAAAEVFYSTVKKKSKIKQSLFYLASIVGNNFPDLDFLYEKISPAPLGYILNHRGHTHTFIMCLPQALLFFAIIYFFTRKQAADFEKSDWLQVFLVGFAGTVLHISADFMNSYGVHPFYPFNNHWVYGDSVFIIEPLIWIVLGLYAISVIKTKLTRVILLAVITIAPVAAWFKDIVTWYSLILVFAFAILFAFLYKKFESQKLKICIFSFFALVATFFVNSNLIKKQIRGQIASENTELLEVAVSPLPANPFCFFYLTVELNSRRELVSKSGIASHILDVANCPQNMFGHKTQTTTPLADFKKWREQDCHFDAWMRFARVPAITQDRAVDLRFSRVGSSGFSDLALQATTQCSGYVPPWIYPREDLLIKASGL